MTEEHLSALLKLAETTKDKSGWHTTGEGRNLTWYLGRDGATLTVSRVEAVQQSGSLLQLRTVKGEVYVVELKDVFAGHVDAPAKQARKAGFV